MLTLFSNKHTVDDPQYKKVPMLAKAVMGVGGDFSITYDLDGKGVNVFVMGEPELVPRIRTIFRLSGMTVEEL